MSGLDLKLAELVGDKEYAEALRKQEAAQKQLEEAIGEKKWAKAVEAADALLKLDPEEKSLYITKYYLLLKTKDEKAAAAWGKELVQKVDDAEMLNALSWTVLTEKTFRAMRDKDLALDAARKADKLSEGKNWQVIDTLARALYESGKKPEAVESEKKALKLATEEKAEEEALAELKKNIGLYEKGEPLEKAGAAAKDDDKDDDEDK